MLNNIYLSRDEEIDRSQGTPELRLCHVSQVLELVSSYAGVLSST